MHSGHIFSNRWLHWAVVHLKEVILHRRVMPASVAQLDGPSNWRPGGCGFNPRQGRQPSFVEIDHEIFSTVILPSADSRRAVVSFWRKNVHNTWLTA